MEIIVKLSFRGKDLAVSATFTGLILRIFCSSRFKFAADKFKNLVGLIDLCLFNFFTDLIFNLKIFHCCVVFVSLFSKYVFSLRYSINVLLLSVPFYICRCIHQALKEKITILVTHQLQHLKDASQILILKDVSNF